MICSERAADLRTPQPQEILMAPQPARRPPNDRSHRMPVSGHVRCMLAKESLPQSLQIQLFEILQKLRSQGRFDPFAVIQKLAPAGRALKMRGAFLDCTRIAVDRWEKPAIGLEMVEPGTSADCFCLSIRLLHVGKHGLQLLPSCLNLGTTERADTVVIPIREVNAHHAVRIGRIATKAAKLPRPGGRLSGGACAKHACVHATRCSCVSSVINCAVYFSTPVRWARLASVRVQSVGRSWCIELPLQKGKRCRCSHRLGKS